MKTLKLRRTSQRENRKTTIFAAAGLHVSLLGALVCVLTTPAWSRTSHQGQSREELGSLTSVGEVYVNGSPASAMSSVSSGDEIRTGESGEAALALLGKGALKIRPLSQVVLSISDQYTAELEKGTVLLNSDPGSDGLIVRIGNYVVVPSVRSIATALRLTKTQDGSFLVHCSEGNIDVLTTEGNSGQVLQAGQSLSVPAKSGLLASSPAPKSKRNSHTRWILLGLAGAGAGAAAAAAFAHGGGNHTVTISGP